MRLSLQKLGVFIAFIMFFAAVSAEKVSVGMGNFQPYFNAESKSGIFTDITNAVFAHMPGHQPEYAFGLSNNALWTVYANGRLDAVANVFDAVELEGCRTDPVFRFHDVAVSRKDDGLVIDSIADLKQKSIITFEGANNFFGEAFKQVISPDLYKEVAKPSLQPRMLMGGRYQVSVGDKFIFLHELKRSQQQRKAGQHSGLASEFVFHGIFPQLQSRFVFRDRALCVQFNQGLQAIRDSGEYERIYAQYLAALSQ